MNYESPRVGSPPVEREWTCVVEEIAGVVQPLARGRKLTERHGYFAYRDEAETWAQAQRLQGFETRVMQCATTYHGPTDSPSNCWSATATKRREG